MTESGDRAHRRSRESDLNLPTLAEEAKLFRHIFLPPGAMVFRSGPAFLVVFASGFDGP